MSVILIYSLVDARANGINFANNLQENPICALIKDSIASNETLLYP